MNASLRNPLLAQLAFAGAAVLGTLASFGATATPAYAAAPGYYEAQLAAPLTGSKTEVQNDVAWKCAGDTCKGNLGTSRAEIACARLVKKFGEVTAFAARGEALDAEGLAKCNGEKTQAVARR